MKEKLGITVQVLPMPERETGWMLRWQFAGSEKVYTKDNFGCGYTLDLAQSIADFMREHPDVVRRNTP